MSVDKLVDSTQLDSDLTSVANAIRAKSGGSSQLAFPAGFVSEIQAIPSGGGDPGYGLKDVSFFSSDGTFEIVVTNNRLTQYTVPLGAYRFFLLKKPIVVTQGDTLTVTYKKISGTTTYSDFVILEQFLGQNSVFTNFNLSTSEQSKSWTKSSEAPATIVGITFRPRNTGGAYANATIAMKIELNGVTLFSSL